MDPKTGHNETPSSFMDNLSGEHCSKVRSCTLRPEANKSKVAALLDVSKRFIFLGGLASSQVNTARGSQIGGLATLGCLNAAALSTCLTRGCELRFPSSGLLKVVTTDLWSRTVLEERLSSRLRSVKNRARLLPVGTFGFTP